MKNTIISLAVAALAASATLVAQGTSQPAPAPATATATPAHTGADPVIITAGPVTIHKSEFEAAVRTLPAEYQQFALGPGKKQFGEDYLRMKLLAARGMKDGLDKDPDVARQLALLKENLVATEELKKIDESIVISDADLKKAYDENKKDYEQVQARHILVAFKGSPAAQKGRKELTDAEARAKAEELRKQIAGGAKFEDVARKESDDVESGKNGGELGAFGHGQMVPEFEKVAFSARDGELTPVVRTQFGYHIIKVEKHSLKPLSDVKAAIEKTLRQKKLREMLDAIKDSTKPEFDEAYFAPPAPSKAATPAPPQKKP